MNERAKLQEAEYFLGRMRAEVNEPASFQHELSAFLTAGRSVLQYAREEARTKSGGEMWFGRWAQDPLIRYFKDARDDNMHATPIAPATHIGVQVYEVMRASDSAVAVTRDAITGIVLEVTSSPEEHPPEMPPVPAASVTYQYRFRDWPGPEDVLTLCEQYLNRVQRFVDEGRRLGFISG